ncbi:MAG: hypothetical protein AAF730_16140, partial [Bacteroidota bacterium]
ENGGSLVSLDGINVSMLSGRADLQSSFEFQTDGDGGFAMDVTGIGRMHTGQNQWKTFGATGTVSTLNDDLSFGIFLAADGINMPLVPGLLDLTGAGGGFFYRPEAEDLNAVYGVLNAMQGDGRTFQPNNPEGLPDASKLQFAIMLYASIGMGGTSGNYGMEGNGLITITDQFTNIDVNGYVLPKAGQSLAGRGYFTVQYNSVGTRIEGGIAMEVDYRPVARTETERPATLDFFANTSRNGATVWAVTGQGTLRILEMQNLSGRFLASNSGFLGQLSSQIDRDAGIISLKGSYSLAFWWSNVSKTMGGYGTIGANASVLGGLAEIGAELRGAVLLSTSGSNDYLFYAAARAYVRVFAVFEGDIELWVALVNRDFDGGTGRNHGYERQVAAAMRLSDEMEAEAEAIEQAMKEVRRQDLVAAFALPQATIEQAGINAVKQEAKYGGRSAVALQRMEHDLQGYWWNPDITQLGDWRQLNGTSPIINRLIGDVLAPDERPSYDPQLTADAREALDGQLEQVQSLAETVDATVSDVELAMTALTAGEDDELALVSPLQNDNVYAFTVDEDAQDTLTETLSTLDEDLDDLGTAYEDRLAEAEQVLTDMDALTSELLRHGYGEAFWQAFEETGDILRIRNRTLAGQAVWADATYGLYYTSNATNRAALFSNLRAVSERVIPFGTNGRPTATGVIYRPTTDTCLRRGYVGENWGLGRSWPGGEKPKLIPGTYVNDCEAFLRTLDLTGIAGLRRSAILTLNAVDSVAVPEGRNSLNSAARAEKDAIYDSFVDAYGAYWYGDGRDRPTGGSANLAAVASAKNALKQLAYDQGVALYYTAFGTGVRSLHNDIRGYLPEAQGIFSTYAAGIQAPLADYSQRLRALYARKTAFAETLAGMYEQYALWLEDQGLAEDATPFRTKRQALLERLAPPMVNDLSVKTTSLGRSGFGKTAPLLTSELSVAWNTSNAEHAYLAVAGLAADTLSGSVGQANAAKLYAFGTSGQQQEVSVQLVASNELGVLRVLPARSVTVAHATLNALPALPGSVSYNAASPTPGAGSGLAYGDSGDANGPPETTALADTRPPALATDADAEVVQGRDIEIPFAVYHPSDAPLTFAVEYVYTQSATTISDAERTAQADERVVVTPTAGTPMRADERTAALAALQSAIPAATLSDPASWLRLASSLPDGLTADRPFLLRVTAEVGSGQAGQPMFFGPFTADTDPPMLAGTKPPVRMSYQDIDYTKRFSPVVPTAKLNRWVALNKSVRQWEVPLRTIVDEGGTIVEQRIGLAKSALSTWDGNPNVASSISRIIDATWQQKAPDGAVLFNALDTDSLYVHYYARDDAGNELRQLDQYHISDVTGVDHTLPKPPKGSVSVQNLTPRVTLPSTLARGQATFTFTTLGEDAEGEIIRYEWRCDVGWCPLEQLEGNQYTTGEVPYRQVYIYDFFVRSVNQDGMPSPYWHFTPPGNVPRTRAPVYGQNPDVGGTTVDW